jgi:uncharacterized protein YjdB
LKFLYIYFI